MQTCIVETLLFVVCSTLLTTHGSTDLVLWRHRLDDFDQVLRQRLDTADPSRPDLAIDETVILLQPRLPLVGVSTLMKREIQQNDSLVNGQPRTSAEAASQKGVGTPTFFPSSETARPSAPIKRPAN